MYTFLRTGLDHFHLLQKNISLYKICNFLDKKPNKYQKKDKSFVSFRVVLSRKRFSAEIEESPREKEHTQSKNKTPYFSKKEKQKKQ